MSFTIQHKPITAALHTSNLPSELRSTPIQTYHQPILAHHHAQIKPQTQPSSGASLERERVRTERKRDFAEKKRKKKNHHHHRDLATPRSTINMPPLHTERNREWEMERESGSERERTKKHKIKREKKTKRIKNQYFVLELCYSAILKQKNLQ